MAKTKLMTAEELFELETDDYRYELVRGELVRMTPPGGQHSKRMGEIYWLLRAFLAENPIGSVYVELGFILTRNPDVVRAPDVAFVRADRLPPGTEPEGYIPFAPDLAVEVVSPNDRARDIEEKVLDYLDAGTRAVWAVYPRRRTVAVYYPDRTARVLREGDELDGGDVLPGFRVSVADIFK